MVPPKIDYHQQYQIIKATGETISSPVETKMLPADQTEYGLEKNLYYGLDVLDEFVYGGTLISKIENAVNNPLRDKPVKVVIIGGGRGNEAIELQEKFGNAVDVHLINKFDGEFYDRKGREEYVQRFYSEELTQERINAYEHVRDNLVVRDVVEDGLPEDQKYDFVVFGRGVMQYIKNPVRLANEFMEKKINDEGFLFLPLEYDHFEVSRWFVFQRSLDKFFKKLASINPSLGFARSITVPSIHIQKRGRYKLPLKFSKVWSTRAYQQLIGVDKDVMMFTNVYHIDKKSEDPLALKLPEKKTSSAVVNIVDRLGDVSVEEAWVQIQDINRRIYLYNSTKFGEYDIRNNWASGC